MFFISYFQKKSEKMKIIFHLKKQQNKKFFFPQKVRYSPSPQTFSQRKCLCENVD
jgi:hypothetical protein